MKQRPSVRFLNLDDHTARVHQVSRSGWEYKTFASESFSYLKCRKHHVAPVERVFFDRGSKGPFRQKRMGLILWTAWGRVRCSFAFYSAFLAFLFRAPSLSSSLVLRGEDGAAGEEAWWWSSSLPARGEPNSRWQTQDSMRAKGEPWEWRAVITTWEDRQDADA